MCFNPSKEEKKKIIDLIKANSSTCCILFEELKKHRTEVKYLVNAFDKLLKKYEKLKLLRKSQMDQVTSNYAVSTDQ